MKKIISLIFVFLLLVKPCQAQTKTRVYETINNTGDDSVTSVPTSLVPVGARILGVNISKTDASLASSAFVSFRDTISDKGETFNEVVAEAETDIDGGTVWFDYPPVIETQLTLAQGARTRVLVFYVR